MLHTVLIIYTGLNFYKILGQAPKYLKPNDYMSCTDLQVHKYLRLAAIVFFRDREIVNV